MQAIAASSETSTTVRRSNRSATAPPSRPTTTIGTNSAAPTRPTATVDPVSCLIWIGTATMVKNAPKLDTLAAIVRSRKSR